jgi:hypothetical protein
MASRTYTVSVAGGTATTSTQIQANGTIKTVLASLVSAAAGSWEVSFNPLSQISSAAPASDVICRVRVGAVAGAGREIAIPLNVSVKAFQNIYVHCTGAGNVGELQLIVG